MHGQSDAHDGCGVGGCECECDADVDVFVRWGVVDRFLLNITKSYCAKTIPSISDFPWMCPSFPYHILELLLH